MTDAFVTKPVRLTTSVYPAIGFFLCAVCLYFYRIDASVETTMSRELGKRREAFATPLPSAP